MTDERLSSPNSKRGQLQRACLALLRQHELEDGGLPTSARFIYYELVQSGVVSKKAKKPKPGQKGRRSDQDMGEALTFLREAGLVPWEWIVDETRSIAVWRFAATVAEYIADTVDEARIDLWEGSPPMIITESRSLAGVLDTLAAEYLVPITATNGQVGGHLHTQVAPRLEVGQRVLYLGDHDWQGHQIEANTRRVLERLVGGELDWRRLAITEEQVRDADPPLPVISKPDKRYQPVRYHDAVETEALGQSAIVRIVRDCLDALLPEPIEEVLERERDQQQDVVALLREHQ
jgi:hypothetical protein